MTLPFVHKKSFSIHGNCATIRHGPAGQAGQRRDKTGLARMNRAAGRAARRRMKMNLLKTGIKAFYTGCLRLLPAILMCAAAFFSMTGKACADAEMRRCVMPRHEMSAAQ